MPLTYPPAPATISGDSITINRFLNSPTLVQRRLRTLVENRFIADRLLRGRIAAQGGAVLYEIAEGIYADRNPRAVDPGSEYPITGVGTGTAALANVVKWGEDTRITDESIRRLGFDPVDKAFVKLVNRMVQYVDSVALAAVASAVTQTQAAAASWITGSPNILRDILLAKKTIKALNQGYDPDVLVVNDPGYAYITSDPTIAALIQRENGQQPILTGEFPKVAGLMILPTGNAPNANPLVADSSALGAMVDENLGGPGYSGGAGGVETKTIREETADMWRLRARRVTVPIVQEPGAGVFITGTSIPAS